MGLVVALAPVARRGLAAHGVPALAVTGASLPPEGPRPEEGAKGDASPRAPIDGLDLVHIGLGDDGATALARGRRVARLTVVPELQRASVAIMARQHLPEGAVVVLDPATGDVLAYASHVERGEARDLCAEARAPAASVFKIITAAALVDDAGLGPETRQCYAGGEQRILPSDLADDPARDRWCVTMAGAMGRSVNAVFARLASHNLTPAQLTAKGHAFAFDAPFPFDAPVESSTLKVPEDHLGFARTAAGFWNTTMSPLHAAWISATIARGGEAIQPRIVSEIVVPVGAPSAVLQAADRSTRRVVAPATAEALTAMMEHTVSEGTSYRAFHDARGTPFLPGITIAGKTGTLTDDRAHRFYTWFTGFAPSHPAAGERQVAIAVLVVNDPTWRVKANVVAREVLREFFAIGGAPGVSRPPGAAFDSD